MKECKHEDTHMARVVGVRDRKCHHDDCRVWPYGHALSASDARAAGCRGVEGATLLEQQSVVKREARIRSAVASRRDRRCQSDQGHTIGRPCEGRRSRSDQIGHRPARRRAVRDRPDRRLWAGACVRLELGQRWSLGLHHSAFQWRGNESSPQSAAVMECGTQRVKHGVVPAGAGRVAPKPAALPRKRSDALIIQQAPSLWHRSWR